LVGVEAAKALAHVWKKPIVPVNHLLAHLYSPWLENPQPPEFPLVALIVSGGHTELFLVVAHRKWWHLGGTRDDAAGEALDKTARLLGLGYPGGPAIEKAAVLGDKTKFTLPRPLIDSPTLDFSFSGLKTAVVNLVNQLGDGSQLTTGLVADLAAGIQETIVEVLVTKTVKAAKKSSVRNIVLGGGVASNKRLRDEMTSKFTGKVYFAPPGLATDNAAMVAAAAYFNYQPSSWDKVHTNPTLLI
jgi:N6-L-threonylcarbamoyladenine synthase